MRVDGVAAAVVAWRTAGVAATWSPATVYTIARMLTKPWARPLPPTGAEARQYLPSYPRYYLLLCVLIIDMAILTHKEEALLYLLWFIKRMPSLTRAYP